MIVVENDLGDNNANMIKATYVLVNLGIVPLLAAYDGFPSFMYSGPLPVNPWFGTDASTQDLGRTSPSKDFCDSSIAFALFLSCSLQDSSSGRQL